MLQVRDVNQREFTIGTKLITAFAAMLVPALAVIAVYSGAVRQSAQRLDSVLHVYNKKLEIGSQVELLTTEMQGAQRGVMLSYAMNDAAAQSLGSAGTLKGVVTDTSGALLPSVLTELSNPVTGYTRKAVTGPDGIFRINNIPQNNYRLRVSLEGFEPHTAEVSIRSTVPVELGIQMAVAGQRTSVTVEAAATNLLENIPTASSTVDPTLP